MKENLYKYEKKRIFGIIPSLGGGGAERQFLVLMEELSKRGYDVTVVTYINFKDCYKVPESVRRVSVHGNNKILDRLKLARFVWSLKSDDIIVAFMTQNVRDVILSSLFLKRKIIAGERNCSQKLGFTEWLTFQLERKAKAVVANSYAQRDWMRRHTPWLASKLTAITNYTDLEKFRPVPDLRNKEDKLVIGVLARFDAQKNCGRFAQAVNLAVKSGCRNFKVIWYGDREALRGGLIPAYVDFKKYVEDNRLEDYVEVRDFTDKVMEVNNYCDVMCLPSLHEGFSNTLSENICCGKPVLASNVGDNPVIVKNGYNGFLFNPRDVEEMAQAIAKVAAMPKEELAAMGRNSRTHAESLFDLNAFADSYINIINYL